MVYGMVLRELKKADGGQLKHAAKIDQLGQLFPAQSFNLFHIGIERFIKPRGNLRRVADIVRTIVWREINSSSADAAQKPVLSGDYMPRQFQRALRHRLRAIVAFVQRYGFNHPLRGFVFCLDIGQRERQKKFGLVGSRETWMTFPFVE